MKWNDEDMLVFSRVGTEGSYGDYRGCKTLASKLEKYKSLKKRKNMEEQIKGLIEFALNPKYSEEGDNYISDGEMNDILIEQLKKLVK